VDIHLHGIVPTSFKCKSLFFLNPIFIFPTILIVLNFVGCNRDKKKNPGDSEFSFKKMGTILCVFNPVWVQSRASVIPIHPYLLI